MTFPVLPPSRESGMSRIAAGYVWVLKLLIALCLAVMVVLVFGNVVLRYGFNRGITLSEELSRWLFVYLTFMGAIVALYERGHLGVDTIVKRLPRMGKRACLFLSQMLMLVVTGLLLWGAWRQTQINWDVTAPISGLSMGLFYGVGLLFSVSALAFLLGDMYRTLTGQVSDAELVMVIESEEQEQLGQFERTLAREDERAPVIGAPAKGAIQ